MNCAERSKYPPQNQVLKGLIVRIGIMFLPSSFIHNSRNCYLFHHFGLRLERYCKVDLIASDLLIGKGFGINFLSDVCWLGEEWTLIGVHG